MTLLVNKIRPTALRRRLSRTYLPRGTPRPNYLLSRRIFLKEAKGKDL